MFSGTYSGTDDSERKTLVLRIDIDSNHERRRALNIVSFDVFSSAVVADGGHQWGQFESTMSAENPDISASEDGIVITGKFKSAEAGSGHETSATIEIDTDDPEQAVAMVAIENGGLFRCQKQGSWFRRIRLEIDAAEPGELHQPPDFPPSYDTSLLDGPEIGDLDLERAFSEAGIKLNVNIDNGDAPAKSYWSLAQLQDWLVNNMAEYGTDLPGPDEDWNIWGFMCSAIKARGNDRPNRNIAGIMFDNGSNATGGNYDRFPRQGFALFREASALTRWLRLPGENPGTKEEQDKAARMMFYTWMHEGGHTFNLPHNHENNRAGVASWMTYPRRYSDGEEDFWEDFDFNFDEVELRHLRHGNWPDVVIGGTDGFLKAGSSGFATADNRCHLLNETKPTYGNPPVEVLVRSQGFFEHMEPVSVELRLRNLMTDCAARVPEAMDLADGRVQVFIEKPNGQVVAFHPIYHFVADLPFLRLVPGYLAEKYAGGDRRSYLFDLTYGSDGFTFEEPGMYTVRATYRWNGSQVITSSMHRLRVGVPVSKERDRVAWDYFRPETGLVWALHGSRSGRLAKGWQILEDIADRFDKTMFGAKAAYCLAEGKATPFLTRDGEGNRCEYPKDIDAALAYSSAALGMIRPGCHGQNLEFHRVAKQQSRWLIESGHDAQAKRCVAALRTSLENAGASPIVLNEVDILGQEIALAK